MRMALIITEYTLPYARCIVTGTDNSCGGLQALRKLSGDVHWRVAALEIYVLPINYLYPQLMTSRAAGAAKQKLRACQSRRRSFTGQAK